MMVRVVRVLASDLHALEREAQHLAIVAAHPHVIAFVVSGGNDGGRVDFDLEVVHRVLEVFRRLWLLLLLLLWLLLMASMASWVLLLMMLLLVAAVRRHAHVVQRAEGEKGEQAARRAHEHLCAVLQRVHGHNAHVRLDVEQVLEYLSISSCASISD